MIVRAGTHRRLVGRAVGTVLGLASLASFLLAAHANADWQDDLQQQLRDDYNCDIAYLSRLAVRDVDGRQVVFVRAHCTDKRSFDASRQNEAERFRIKACDVQAC
ncbi:MAG TPA: hypothetical protein VI113_13055 [Alphaproteobacteria bacterium]